MPQDNLLPPVDPGSQPDAGDAGVPNEGTTSSGKRDEGKSPDLSKYVPVDQLNKLRSTMDKQIAAQQKQFQQLKEQYDSLVEWREKNEREGLTDEELVAYEAERAQYEANQKVQEANRRSAELEYEKNFLALKQYYLSKGAPQAVVGLDDPAEMQEAFLNWLIERATKAEQQLAKAGQPAPEGKGKQPPTVTTHKPAAGTLGKASWSAVKPGSKEEAELFAKVEAGLMKPEDIEP